MASRFTWQKLGLIFSPQRDGQRSWMKSHAQAPATLVLDDRIRVYFSTRPLMDANGQYKSFSTYIDLSRSDPTQVMRVADRPILQLGERGTFDEFGIYPFSAIRSDSVVIGYYGGWTRCQSVPFNVAIGCALSRDGGETFTRLGPGPILSYSPDEPFVVSGPKIRRFGDTFYLYYIAGKRWVQTRSVPEPVYRIRMATSEDGFSWTRIGKDLIPPRVEDDEAQASPDVFWMDDRYHMFFSYRRSTNYRRKTGSYRIGYAYSFDLVTWTRRDEWAGLGLSATGWDSEMVAYPHVFSIDDSYFMAYLGNGVGRDGFGLARLTDYRGF